MGIVYIGVGLRAAWDVAYGGEGAEVVPVPETIVFFEGGFEGGE